jgi:hypothetical protein
MVKKKATPAARSLRAGGQRVDVENSGLEVWLYDEANREAIAKAGAPEEGAGGMPPRFGQSAKKGLIVGYSMEGDGAVDPEIHVGKAFTEQELSAGRWLEPQTALLKIPSGVLCIESNDASRVGPEEPGAKGATVKVPPGDYRLTLIRADHEALDREGIEWKGPNEIVLLTPGGKASDAIDELLPFENRRDTSWVGKYTIAGTKAEVLAWFSDYWDTFFVNLDNAGCRKLGLTPGRHFRTTVPKAGLTMITVFGPTWDVAKRMPVPSNVDLAEYGYGAVIKPQDWGQEETLFCRRDKTKTRAEDKVQNIWIPATIELLDEEAHPPKAPSTEIVPIDLTEKEFFDDGFLTMVLSEFLPEVEDRESLPLGEALGMIDDVLEEMDLVEMGDIGWTRDDGVERRESGVRLYAGAPDCFAAVIASEGNFEFLFMSEAADGTWIVSGMVDALDRTMMRTDARGIPVPHPRIKLTNIDEPVAKVRVAHTKALGKTKLAEMPKDLLESAAALVRFMETAAK